MDSDAGRWPELQPPEGLDGDGAPFGQRARLRQAIERLRTSQAAHTGDAMDEEQRAAEADMLDVLLTLDTAAGEALHRALPAPEDEAR
ncbi:MAG TPA: hypothetical protein VFE42_15300 [Chloroflexota bacterium]|jgi:hypothetical protein|nr:hypothetical protein [Chloroflexota bacterium]